MLVHVVRYCSRTTGGISLAVGLASYLMQGPEYFWVATGLIYFGLVVFALDVFLEPWPRAWFRWVAFPVILLVGVAFSWFWVFASAPLNVAAFYNDAVYPPGTMNAGIGWRPDFGELRVHIANPSDRNYFDLDLLVQPDVPIAAVAQLTSVTEVSFQDRLGLNVTAMIVDISKRRKDGLPVSLVATDAGYRVRAGKLSRKTELKIVMATTGLRAQPAIEERDKLFEITYPGFRYWFGFPSGNIYVPSRAPKVIRVAGEYVATQRRRDFAAEIPPTAIDVSAEQLKKLR
jgi:hypothetical protein